MFEKLESVAARCMQLDKLLSDSEIITDQKLFHQYAKERSDLSELLDNYQHYQKVCSELEESEEFRERLEKITREYLKTEKMEWSQKKEIDKALEVWKSPMARQTEGAVGGTIDIKTRAPLDYKSTQIRYYDTIIVF